MECMNKKCDNKLTGRQKTFCSDKCRKAQSRTVTRTNETRTECKVSDLPEFIPEPIRKRYALAEPEYMIVIDRLLSHTLEELEADNVWVPVWREQAGEIVLKEQKTDDKMGKLESDDFPSPIDCLPANFGQSDCKCIHCRQCRTNRLNVTLHHGSYGNVVIGLGIEHLIRVELPGDIDYVGAGTAILAAQEQR